jgi:hypothetical protein
VTRRIAQELVRTHPADAIRQQLAWQASRPPATSPAGALVRAIRDAWPPPPAWLEAQAHAATVARQADAETQRRAQDEVRRREWAQKPPEERIAGRLHFWLLGRRREWAQKPPEERIAGRLHFWLLGRRRKGHEPMEAEIAAKRAELLAGLAAADGVC